MALGTNRTRNWGKEAQECALALLLKRERVAYKVVTTRTGLRCREVLFLAPSHNGITLPFIDAPAELFHVRRGHWEARHPFDGRVMATGVSHRDVIRSTIQAVWQ